jgi:hypothetical protein
MIIQHRLNNSRGGVIKKGRMMAYNPMKRCVLKYEGKLLFLIITE